MSLEERVYSVLVVSASEKSNTALSDLLPESHYQPVRIVASVSEAKLVWSERGFDFVIVNSPLPDDPGTRFAVDVCDSGGAAVLILSRSELCDGVRERVTAHGIFTLPKPVSRPILSLALDWMAAVRERMRKMEKKAVSFEEKMEEIRAVNRAKWLLISELKMDEPQAHRYIEKQAMDRCVPKHEVAEEIIRTYS